MNNCLKFKGALSHLAFKEKASKGRRYDLEQETELYDGDELLFNLVNPWVIDFLKIANSKAFRRLSDKTQVFPLPKNPHIRDRLKHTLEVMGLSAFIAETLGLNADLARAIALGHDLGHTPFGHFGERYISQASGRRFNHAVCSVVICQIIERKGGGLNLCGETLLGIMHHTNTGDLKLNLAQNLPQEINIVKIADKISYAFSDQNDAKRCGYIQSLRETPLALFGPHHRERVGSCILALIEESAQQGFISFSLSEVAQNFRTLMAWQAEHIYPKIDFCVHKTYLDLLIEFFQKEPYFEGWDPYLLLALLTDVEVFQFGELCKSAEVNKLVQIQNFGIMEIVPNLRGKNIDFTQPHLDWVK